MGRRTRPGHRRLRKPGIKADEFFAGVVFLETSLHYGCRICGRCCSWYRGNRSRYRCARLFYIGSKPRTTCCIRNAAAMNMEGVIELVFSEVVAASDAVVASFGVARL